MSAPFLSRVSIAISIWILLARPVPAGRKKTKRKSYVDRDYRDFSEQGNLVAFPVSWKETDLYIRAEKNLAGEALEAIRECRAEIESYIRRVPAFQTSLVPLPLDPHAHPIVQEMMRAAESAGVGPMAAVAGTVAEYVGKKLEANSRSVMVENGGDIYLRVDADTTIGIFAGSSPLSLRMGVRIPASRTPCGVCTSSGTVGPSLSFGNADAVVVWADRTSLADAAATALGNRIHSQETIAPSLEWAKQIDGIHGIVVISGEQAGIWGSMHLVKLKPRQEG